MYSNMSPHRNRYLQELEDYNNTILPLNSRKMDDMNCIIQPTPTSGGIWLGNMESASSVQMLERNNIGAILSVCQNPIPINVRQNLLLHHVCYAEDHENFNIKKYFSETYEFLEKALRVTNVLVHCMAGISRSAAVVIAYLVRKRQIGVLEAMEFVRSCRWQIYPNNGFLRQLAEFEKEIFIPSRQEYQMEQTSERKRIEIPSKREIQQTYESKYLRSKDYDKAKQELDYLIQLKRELLKREEVLKRPESAFNKMTVSKYEQPFYHQQPIQQYSRMNHERDNVYQRVDYDQKQNWETKVYGRSLDRKLQTYQPGNCAKERFEFKPQTYSRDNRDRFELQIGNYQKDRFELDQRFSRLQRENDLFSSNVYERKKQGNLFQSSYFDQKKYNNVF